MKSRGVDGELRYFGNLFLPRDISSFETGQSSINRKLESLHSLWISALRPVCLRYTSSSASVSRRHHFR